MNDPEEEAAMVKEKLVTSYKNNNIAENLMLEVQESDENLVEDGSEEKSYGRWSTTWCQQFSVLLRRGIKERKHDSFSGLKIGQVLAVAIMSGLLWWQSDDSHLQDKVSILYHLILIIMLLLHKFLSLLCFNEVYSNDKYYENMSGSGFEYLWIEIIIFKGVL